MARSLVATEIGVKRAKEALIDLGITQTVLAEKRLKYSRSTVSNFFNRKPIAHENFTEICKILKLEWRDIAEIAEGEANQDDTPESSATDASSKSAKQEFKQIDDKVKQVEKQIRLAFAIAGTVNQVDEAKLNAIVKLLRQITGDASIEIVDIQEGSIKLILTGTPEALVKIQTLYRLGRLLKVEGKSVIGVNFENLSEACLSGTNLSGADLYRKDLSGANLIGANFRKANLSGANLSESNLSEADLSGANLSESNLSEADLSGANLSGADLNRANFSKADLSYINLSRADLSGANLSGASLSKADLSGASLSKADLSRADLSGANLSRADLSRADLSRADLIKARLVLANLSGANLSGANLIGVNLSYANLIRANLIRANLSGADLSETNLSRADLIGANLSGANLSKAKLIGADLSRANLSGANLSEANLSEANLSEANLSEADLSEANLRISIVELARFRSNQGISEEMKQNLISKGAIFDDVQGNDSRILTPSSR